MRHLIRDPIGPDRRDADQLRPAGKVPAEPRRLHARAGQVDPPARQLNPTQQQRWTPAAPPDGGRSPPISGSTRSWNGAAIARTKPTAASPTRPWRASSAETSAKDWKLPGIGGTSHVVRICARYLQIPRADVEVRPPRLTEEWSRRRHSPPSRCRGVRRSARHARGVAHGARRVQGPRAVPLPAEVWPLRLEPALPAESSNRIDQFRNRCAWSTMKGLLTRTMLSLVYASTLSDDATCEPTVNPYECAGFSVADGFGSTRTYTVDGAAERSACRTDSRKARSTAAGVVLENPLVQAIRVTQIQQHALTVLRHELEVVDVRRAIHVSPT